MTVSKVWALNQITRISIPRLHEQGLHPVIDHKWLMEWLIELPDGCPPLDDDGWYVLTRMIQPEACTSAYPCVMARASGKTAINHSWRVVGNLLGAHSELHPPFIEEFLYTTQMYFDFLNYVVLDYLGHDPMDPCPPCSRCDQEFAYAVCENMFSETDIPKIIRLVCLWQEKMALLPAYQIKSWSGFRMTKAMIHQAFLRIWESDSSEEQLGWTCCFPGAGSNVRANVQNSIEEILPITSNI